MGTDVSTEKRVAVATFRKSTDVLSDKHDNNDDEDGDDDVVAPK